MGGRDSTGHRIGQLVSAVPLIGDQYLSLEALKPHAQGGDGWHRFQVAAIPRRFFASFATDKWRQPGDCDD